MGMEDTTLKACSTGVGHEGTSPLQEAARELQSPEETSEKLASTKAKRKKQQKTPEIKEMKRLRKSFNEMTESVTKLEGTEMNQNMTPEIKEMKRLRKSFKEMTESVKNLERTLLTKADPPGTKEKNVEESATYKCLFESKETFVMNKQDHTLFVRGFDPCLPKDDLKTALWKHFGAFGVVTRVFVPTECKTGATIGYAFVDMQSDANKFLHLNGSSIGGWNLDVTMAKGRSEFFSITNLRGCPRCSVILRQRIAKISYRAHRAPYFKDLISSFQRPRPVSNHPRPPRV